MDAANRPQAGVDGVPTNHRFNSAASADLPSNTGRELQKIRDGVNRPNVRGPERFQNRNNDLPTHDRNGNAITYTKYTVNPRAPGQKLDQHRIIEGSDGKWYYWNHQEGNDTYTFIND